MHAARRRLSIIRRLLAGAIAAATMVALMALAPVGANAAESEAAPVIGPGASSPGLGGSWGQDLVFEQAAQDIGPNQAHYRLSPQPDGSVMFITDGSCLASGFNFFIPDGVWAVPCRDVPQQKFYIVPQNHTPHSSANMSRGDQYFYIVSAQSNKCIWSARGGLNFSGGQTELPRMLSCSEGDVGQEFRIYNERPNPDGIYNEWQNLLNQAVVYATNHCAADHGSCTVSSQKAPTPGAWYRPDDDAVAQFGTMSTASFGCGVGTSINGVSYSPTVTNLTRDNENKTVGAQVSLTKSTQVTETLGYTFSLEVSGGAKDVWGVKVTNGFSYNHQTVTGSSATQTTSDTTSAIVRPGDTLMTTWSGNVYTISGTWKFAENVPVFDPVHRSLSWTMPATSSYPMTVENQAIAHLTSVSSKYPKNCDASAPAKLRSDSMVSITTASGSCDAAVATPETVSSGTTLKACPGAWDVPIGKGSSNTSPVYQWYVVGADGTSRYDIEGATRPTFTVQRSTYSAATPNLGVAVYDQGNPDRLESRPAEVAMAKVVVLPPAPGDPVQIASNFVGAIDDAQTGLPYSAALVAGAGTGLNLSWSGLPDGFDISADGVLSGVPTRPGTFAIELTDTPADGPVQQHVIELIVYNPPAAFRNDTSLPGTTGVELNEALVPEVPAGMQLSVSAGQLPAGLSLDSATGVVSGVPASSGSYAITLQDAASPNTYGVFSFVISDPRAAFADGGLPTGKVGAAYTAATVSQAGPHSLFALSADSESLPDGLSLDADTGLITGTPLAAVRTDVVIVDLSDRSVTVSLELVVAAADSSLPPAPDESSSGPVTGSSGALAKTGFEAQGLLLGAAVLVLLGGASLFWRRRELRG